MPTFCFTEIPMPHGSLARFIVGIVGGAGLVVSAGTSAVGTIDAPADVARVQVAATTEFERGPAPTLAAVEGTGPFSTSSATVSTAAARGFGGADIYYPTSTTSGTFGGVAISPGYTASRSSLSWYARRLASHGFVVINIDTNGRYDQPSSRGAQLLAALDYLTGSSPSAVRTRLDPARLAVSGHSMGGGGSLQAAKDRGTIDAVVALTPYNTDKTWPEIGSPTQIIGAQDDSTARNSSHSIPFYNSLPTGTPKAYVELRGEGHLAPTRTNATISRYAVSWLKRFVDQDTRYQQFLCPPATSTTVSDHRSPCSW